MYVVNAGRKCYKWKNILYSIEFINMGKLLFLVLKSESERLEIVIIVCSTGFIKPASTKIFCIEEIERESPLDIKKKSKCLVR